LFTTTMRSACTTALTTANRNAVTAFTVRDAHTFLRTALRRWPWTMMKRWPLRLGCARRHRVRSPGSRSRP
jgi:hypothetical protein